MVTDESNDQIAMMESLTHHSRICTSLLTHEHSLQYPLIGETKSKFNVFANLISLKRTGLVPLLRRFPNLEQRMDTCLRMVMYGKNLLKLDIDLGNNHFADY